MKELNYTIWENCTNKKLTKKKKKNNFYDQYFVNYIVNLNCINHTDEKINIFSHFRLLATIVWEWKYSKITVHNTRYPLSKVPNFRWDDSVP